MAAEVAVRVLETFWIEGNSIELQVCAGVGEEDGGLFLRLVRVNWQVQHAKDESKGMLVRMTPDKAVFEMSLAEADHMFDALAGASAYSRATLTMARRTAGLATCPESCPAQFDPTCGEHRPGIAHRPSAPRSTHRPHDEVMPAKRAGACSMEGCNRTAVKFGLCRKDYIAAELDDDAGGDDVFRDPAEKTCDSFRVRFGGRITKPAFNSKGAAKAYLFGLQNGRKPEY